MAETTTDPFAPDDRSEWTARQRIDEQLRLAVKHKNESVFVSRADLEQLLIDVNNLSTVAAQLSEAIHSELELEQATLPG